MPTYIALLDYTEQGIRNIKESPSRADSFLRHAEGAGVTVKDIYWTTGSHDGVIIMEAPSSKPVSSLLLSIAKQGNVRTHTLEAYPRAEMESILANVE